MLFLFEWVIVPLVLLNVVAIFVNRAWRHSSVLHVAVPPLLPSVAGIPTFLDEETIRVENERRRAHEFIKMRMVADREVVCHATLCENYKPRTI